MPLRLIEFTAPADAVDSLHDLQHSLDVLDRWEVPLTESMVLVRLLVDTKRAEGMLDDLQTQFGRVEGFRIVMLPVEATVPRPEQPEPADIQAEKSPDRISREEIYHDIVDSAEVSRIFVIQVILATVVAAVGLVRNDTAVLIGAMVIAPLLGPNMSLCLATTLGDLDLIRKSLKTNFVGLAVALCASMSIGFLLPISPEIEAITSRTHVSTGDIILALASGCAGVLAFTSGAPSALIGVMVAVALLPPFTVFGLLLATGEYAAASGALMLVSTNVICVNLSGVLTFFAQGLRPRTWWETERATKATRIAVVVWTTLLLVLLGLIYMATLS